MRRISPSLVIAIVALLLACSGGAVAAGYITGSAVKDGTLTGKDIKNSSLSGEDLGSATIGPSKLSDGLMTQIEAAGTTPGPAGPIGPAGPAGAAGPAGPQGPAGPSATSAITLITGYTTVAANDIGGGIAACPAGQKAISGGYFSDSGYAFSDHPTPDRTGWQIGIDNSGATVSADVTGYVQCAGSGQAVAASTRSKALAAPSSKFAQEIERRKLKG